MREFDLCVIGSGPGGQRAAIQAAKLNKSVCVVEKMQVVGGVAINTGTIPSKALREAVMNLVGLRRQGTDIYLNMDRQEQLASLVESCQRVIRAEIETVRRHFFSNGVELVHGTGSLVDEHTVHVDGIHSTEEIRAKYICLATGTNPARPDDIPFDDSNIITSDELLKLPYMPRSMIVVGGGVIGTEYASMLSALGVRVTLIEGRDRVLGFVDKEIGEALQYHLRQSGMTLRLGEKVVKINSLDQGENSAHGDKVEAMLESGKTIRGDTLLYCVGRQGTACKLNLESAGLKADNRGRVQVDEHYRTEVGHIYGVGDVIGFPALASTSMEQGRLAACHMFGAPADTSSDLFPFGIYSIPEISMVGWTEEKLTEDEIPYEAGIGQYKETARGQLIGDEIGMLKLLIHQESGAILGVHAIGTNATELIHIGQAVMYFKGGVDYFINTVFNYPTLAECYKLAAFNGLNKIKQ